MRKKCKLVLVRSKKDLVVGSLVKYYDNRLMALTVEPDNLIYYNCESVEPYLVDDDELCVGDLVYHHIWEIVGTIISIGGSDIEVDWGDFKHSHYSLVKSESLSNVIGEPDKIGYLAHGYGRYPDDAFYDIMEYEDIEPLIDRGYCYVEYEEVLKHRLSGRVLRERPTLNMNLSGYDYVWLPKELKGKIIIHYEN